MLRKGSRQNIYHAVNITTAALMMTTWGNYIFTPYGAGIAVRILYHLTCALAPALFIHFIFVFPEDREKKNKKNLYLLYIIAGCLFFLLNYSFIKIINDQTPESFGDYISATNLFHIYIVVLTIWGIYLFIKSYLNSESLAEKKKIKWLILGFLIGPGGYIFLWVLPQIFIIQEMLPEEFIIVFMTAIPLTFGISIYRYRLLDIDVIFNRSTVYGIVIALAIIIYMVIVGGFYILVGALTVYASIYVSTTAALLIGLLFQPLKNRVQNFVNKKFFKINYNFNAAHKLLFDEINKSYTIEILVDKIRGKIDEILQPSDILIYLPDSEVDPFFTRKKDAYKIEQHILSKLSSPKTILAEKDYIESDVNFIPIIENNFNFKLIIPITVSLSGKGFIALGKKKSAMRFNHDDADFLNDVALQSALAVERINLQKELILKQAESERLRDLNEMKSLFISAVSHELKTPLTSIKMFVQLLQEKEMSVERKNKFLRIIEKEGDRLTRLIDNILDYSKIEKGKMDYRFEKIDLDDILMETLDIMEYHLTMYKFEVKVSYSEAGCWIYADKDAVKEALINLISNAIKYSGNNKSISIKTFLENEFVCVNIQDEGIGIPEDDIKNIFEPFIRLNNFEKKKIDGTGIGLSIVKHIMDSHNGRIEIKSEEDNGSCFTLFFPYCKKLTSISGF